MVDEGRPQREGLDRRGKIQALVREERLDLGLVEGYPGDRHLHLVQWVGRGHGPVAAEGQPGAGSLQAGERVLVAHALRSQDVQVELPHLRIEAGPERLAVRHHTEFGESGDIVRVDDLEMRDVVAMVGRPIRCFRGFERVQRLSHGPVADGVDMDLEAF